jgi:PAS domain S-box-containing protein
MDTAFPFKALVDQLTDEVLMLRVTGTGSFEIAYYNIAFNNKYNNKQQPLTGQPADACINADCWAKMQVFLNSVIAVGKVTCYEETMQLNGEEVILSITLIPFADDAGNIDYIACCSKDITSLKKHEKHSEDNKTELKETANVYQSIIDSTNNIILLLDTGFHIRIVNKAALQFAKKMYNEDILIGTNALDYISGQQKETALEHLQKVLKDQLPVSHEQQIITHDGYELWFFRRYYPVYNTKKKLIGILIASNEITEAKNRELYIKKQNSRLRDIANMQSHILRRPVANILGLIDLLNINEYDEGEFDHFLQLLKESADQLDGVIKSIVETSKID